MRKNRLVAPVVKWVGGKRQLLDDLTPLFPKRVTSYCEPFLGGGAVLFKLQPNIAYVNDINSELIQMYEVIRDNVDELIIALGEHPNEEDHFYSVRDWDRNKEQYGQLTKVQRAARIIYLNKTCYNGLFRVNNAGEFNTPFGHYKNPNIVNAPTLKAVSAYFQKAQLTFSSVDYAEVLANVAKGTFVYLDPPYRPISETSAFTSYNSDAFDDSEQIRLAKFIDEINEVGAKLVLSNSDPKNVNPDDNFFDDLYKSYSIHRVSATRMINSNAEKRGKINELLICN